MPMNRRSLLFGGGVTAASLVIANISHKFGGAFDFEPFAPETPAQAFADIFRYSNSSSAREISPAYLENLVTDYGPASVVGLLINGNVHTFQVRTARISNEPVLALYEEGERVGTAKPWKSPLTPAQIYGAVEQKPAPSPSRSAPSAKIISASHRL